jgi:hypothetical protein
MYRRFAFEGDIHEALDCVPLSVRRKLDLAALKISLEGWQKLARSDRLALCHLPVGSDLEIDVYREVMRGFCDRAAVPLKPLDDPNAAARAWSAPQTPDSVRARVVALGADLADHTWRALDEESRYALVKLGDPKRNPNKIHALLVELGLLAGPAPLVHPKVVVCEPEPAGRGTPEKSGPRAPAVRSRHERE